jgi:hypothetical protein
MLKLHVGLDVLLSVSLQRYYPVQEAIWFSKGTLDYPIIDNRNDILLCLRAVCHKAFEVSLLYTISA